MMPAHNVPRGIDVYVDLDCLLDMAWESIPARNAHTVNTCVIPAEELVLQCMRVLAEVNQSTGARYTVYSANQERPAYDQLHVQHTMFSADLRYAYMEAWCRTHDPNLDNLKAVQENKRIHEQQNAEILRARKLLHEQFQNQAMLGQCGKISSSENLTKHWQTVKLPRLLIAKREPANMSMVLNHPDAHWVIEPEWFGAFSIQSAHNLVNHIQVQLTIKDMYTSVDIRNFGAIMTMLLADQPKLRSVNSLSCVLDICREYPYLKLVDEHGAISSEGIRSLLHIVATREEAVIDDVQGNKMYSNYTKLCTIFGVKGTVQIRARLETLSNIWCKFINMYTGAFYATSEVVSQIIRLYPEEYSNTLRGVTTLQQAWNCLSATNRDPHPNFNLVPRLYTEPKTLDDAVHKFNTLTLPVFREMEKSTCTIDKSRVDIVDRNSDGITACSYVTRMVLSAQRFIAAESIGSPAYGTWDKHGSLSTQLPTPQALREFADDRGGVISALQRAKQHSPTPAKFMMYHINDIDTSYRPQLAKYAASAMVTQHPESVRALGYLLPTYGARTFGQVIPRIVRLAVLRR